MKRFCVQRMTICIALQAAALLIERLAEQPGSCDSLFTGQAAGLAGLVANLAAGDRGRAWAAVSALTALAGGSDAARQRIAVDADAVAPLVTIARGHAADPLAACHAAGTLAELFQSERVRLSLSQSLNAGAVVLALVDMAGSDDAGVQAAAARALAILSTSDSLHGALAAAVPSLGALAGGDSAPVAQLALAALAQLSAGAEPARRKVCWLLSAEAGWEERHPPLECYRMAICANLAAFAELAPLVLQVRCFATSKPLYQGFHAAIALVLLCSCNRVTGSAQSAVSICTCIAKWS